MDRAEYVNKRKAKYMAQALEGLEEMVVAGLAPEHADAVARYRELRDAPRLPGSPPVRAFQTCIEPLLSADAVLRVRSFAGLLRARFNALASDAVDMLNLDGDLNGVAVDLRDGLSPVGRP